jgi:DNA replication and repair protein RecF
MTAKVEISRLRLENFRNYARLSLALDGRHVVLTGENGAGKTNLLEAVSFLSPGRGLRRAAYGEAVRSDASGAFTVFAALDGMAGPAEIGTAAGEPGEPATRRLRVNGANVRTTEALSDHLRVLWLTPAMDGLFTGPAGERRRFLDRMVLSLDPLHGRRTVDYERAMRGRNRLLAEGGADPAWLEGLEVQMAELGIAMALARRDAVRLLAGVIDRTQEGDGPFPRADIALAGFLDEAPETAATDMEAQFQAMLRDGRRRDAAAGRAIEGPHRVDLTVRHRAKAMPAEYCSTGEQKALLVGLVLAHARLVAEMTGHAPVLLLDEIAAHLDAGRRAALFDLVDGLGGQAFMTGTDASMFAALGNRAQFFTVREGAVTETETALPAGQDPKRRRDDDGGMNDE